MYRNASSTIAGKAKRSSVRQITWSEIFPVPMRSPYLIPHAGLNPGNHCVQMASESETIYKSLIRQA